MAGVKAVTTMNNPGQPRNTTIIDDMINTPTNPGKVSLILVGEAESPCDIFALFVMIVLRPVNGVVCFLFGIGIVFAD